MQFDLFQSNFLITVLWNYLLFHSSITLFFNSIHAQCCNTDRNLSVCLFFVVCFLRETGGWGGGGGGAMGRRDFTDGYDMIECLGR